MKNAIRRSQRITEAEADLLYTCLPEAPELPYGFDRHSVEVQSLIKRGLLDVWDLPESDAYLYIAETTARGRALLVLFRNYPVRP